MAFAALDSNQVRGYGTKGDGVLTEAANDAGVSDGAAVTAMVSLLSTTNKLVMFPVPRLRVSFLLPPTVAPANWMLAELLNRSSPSFGRVSHQRSDGRIGCDGVNASTT